MPPRYRYNMTTDERQPQEGQNTNKKRSQNNNGNVSCSNTIMDSVVQGVSQLSMSCSPSIALEEIFGNSFWDDNNTDDNEEEASQTTASTHAETTTTTATSRSDSCSENDQSPVPPNRICRQGRSSSSSHSTSNSQVEAPLASLSAGTYMDILSHWNYSLESQKPESHYQHRPLQDEQQQQQQHIRQQPELPQQQSQTPTYRNDRQAPTYSFPSTAIDLDDMSDHSDTATENDIDADTNTDIDLKASTTSTIATRRIPETAVDLDDDLDDDDILSYGSQELAACWDDDDNDDDNDNVDAAYFNAVVEDDDEEFSHQLDGYQDDDLLMTIRDNQRPQLIIKDDGGNGEPPLSAQTSYAREQLLQSERYRTMQQEKELQQLQREVDEVDISRGLGGYEEGFDVPVPTMVMHEYHELPFKISEEPEEEDISSSDEERSVGTTQEETLTYNQYAQQPQQRVDADDRRSGNGDITNGNYNKSLILVKPPPMVGRRISQSESMESACFHCSQGMCENEDCSGSRFMI